MKELTIVKLQFTSPLHLHRGKGAYDVSSSHLHSDTIAAAVCTMAYRMFESFEAEEYLKLVKFSSAFPFVGNNYFFPKPMIKLPISIEGFGDHESSKEAKKLKKIEFIEKSIFEKIINATRPFSIPQEYLRSGGKYVSEHDFVNFMQFATQQRVSVSRDNSDSVPYYIQRIYFDQSNGDSGLYFFLESQTEEAFDKTIRALLLLADEGLGTDRAVGNGQFNVVLDKMSIQLPSSAHQMTLSLYWPKKDESQSLLKKDCSYTLVNRGGYLAGASNTEHRHLRRKSVYMFGEGSVFEGNEMEGTIGNLKPSWNDDSLHEIWRSGRCFHIPIINASR